ncbi:hypothetical protein [Salinicola avicenniae]|uniref:hypothetical protein n=1 Tax=Salinicola avicenniae TaxID=2916836 RepID=UPI002074A0F0|nr:MULTISPECIES: hypothetical protein [unclassified Salinicola]
MIRLERSILDQANARLRALEEHVLEGTGDLAQALADYHQLQAYFSLPKENDSGMSEECQGMLEEIERRANIIHARLDQ